MKKVKIIAFLLAAVWLAVPAFAQEKEKEKSSKEDKKAKEKQRKKLVKGYKKTKEGLYYKFYTQTKGGVKPKTDDFVTVNMIYKNEQDTTIFDSKLVGEKMEFPLMPSTFKGSFEDALMMMSKGDSASFWINGDSLYLRTFGLEALPEGIKPSELLKFEVKLVNVRTKEEVQKEQMEQYAQEMAKIEQRKFAEPGEIAQYLKDNNITTQPTASGLYYIETKKGTGSKVEAGDTVQVHYTGMFLDGKPFDSSIGGAPIEFPVGVGMVIPGWDEGLQLMNEGGKAKFLIPSALAYGESGVGEGLIPSYTPLVFEVEVVKVMKK